MARITTRMLSVCCLVVWAVFCPAQNKPGASESRPGPAQLELERLRAPEAFATLVAQRRWDKVLKVALQSLSERPADPVWNYWAGVARFHQRDFVEAVISLRVADKLGLDTAPLHEALGIAYYSIHQYLLFLQQMEAAIRADPAASAPYYYLGRYYEHNAKDYRKALSYFDKALERDAGDFKSLYFRASCLQMLGQNAEAQAGYEAAIQRIDAGSEKFGWSYQKLAELLLPTDPAAALQYARKAVDLEPAVEENHLILAKVFESRGDLEAAIRECLEAARLKPNDPHIRYVLLRLYQKKGDRAAAAEQLKLHEKLRAIYASEE